MWQFGLRRRQILRETTEKVERKVKQKREAKRAIPGVNVIASGDGKVDEKVNGGRIWDLSESVEMCAV